MVQRRRLLLGLLLVMMGRKLRGSFAKRIVSGGDVVGKEFGSIIHCYLLDEEMFNIVYTTDI
jgi:hypothetical protein